LVFQMAPTGHVTFLTKNGFFDDFWWFSVKKSHFWGLKNRTGFEKNRKVQKPFLEISPKWWMSKPGKNHDFVGFLRPTFQHCFLSFFRIFIGAQLLKITIFVSRRGLKSQKVISNSLIFDVFSPKTSKKFFQPY
jgi:hypothetical protein